MLQHIKVQCNPYPVSKDKFKLESFVTDIPPPNLSIQIYFSLFTGCYKCPITSSIRGKQSNVSASVCACSVLTNSTDPMDCDLIRLHSAHGISSKNQESGIAISSLQGFSQPRQIKPCLLRLLHWAGRFLPLSHQGAPTI